LQQLGTVVWLIGFRIGLGVCLLKMVIVVSIVCRSVVQGVAGLVFELQQLCFGEVDLAKVSDGREGKGHSEVVNEKGTVR
jgi:hypothetical protein